MENEQLLRLIQISLEKGYGILLNVAKHVNMLSMLKIIRNPELTGVQLKPVYIIIAWSETDLTIDFQQGHLSERLDMEVGDLLMHLVTIIENKTINV